MTRRERLESKVEKRQEWAGKAHARSDARFNAADAISSRIPFGQPILVGHHSERRARRDADKIWTNMGKGMEEHKLAEHHESKGQGLASQLERTIFDDDPDAIERLEARIADREKSATYNNALNAAWRKGFKKGGAEGAIAALMATGASQALAETLAKTALQFSWLTRKGPCDATGERAAIRTDKERIIRIKAKQARAELAQATPTGVLIENLASGNMTPEYVRVTFPEKPSREILTSLRQAGFRWTNGSWVGLRLSLPTELGAPS